jgi:hypothetical protein
MRKLRIQIALAPGNGANRVDQHLRRAAFGQVAQRPGLQGALGVAGVFVGRQGQDARFGIFGHQALDRLDTADAGHGNVHHHHIGCHAFIHLARRFTAVGFCNDFNVGKSLQQ